jgi:hypothetical protein
MSLGFNSICRNALVMCVGEKPQIPALNRTAPFPALRPGIPARMTHDNQRNGTTSLLAALEVASGKLHGRCYRRHRHPVGRVAQLGLLAGGLLGQPSLGIVVD